MMIFAVCFWQCVALAVATAPFRFRICGSSCTADISFDLLSTLNLSRTEIDVIGPRVDHMQRVPAFCFVMRATQGLTIYGDGLPFQLQLQLVDPFSQTVLKLGRILPAKRDQFALRPDVGRRYMHRRHQVDIQQLCQLLDILAIVLVFGPKDDPEQLGCATTTRSAQL